MYIILSFFLLNFSLNYFLYYFRSQILSKQSSHSDSGTKIVGKEEATGSLFRNTHNDPDFPIFTQNEIDELVMLDMHDTLFTSNPPHNFSSQISDLEYFPSNYTIPTPFELQNIQPALDHLHPYYQVSILNLLLCNFRIVNGVCFYPNQYIQCIFICVVMIADNVIWSLWERKPRYLATNTFYRAVYISILLKLNCCEFVCVFVCLSGLY